jgi:pimeloyl-ACP methyl ester carboxylesterase
LGLGSAHVVASSVGGWFALRAAIEAPDRVDRMVQLGCPAFVPGFRTPGFMRLLMLNPFQRLVNALPPNRRVGPMMLRQIGHGASLAAGRITDVFMSWSFSLLRDTDTMRNEARMISLAGGIRGFDTTLTMTDDLLRSVKAPTLFVWGEDDPFGGAGVAQRVVDLVPDATLELLTASGHLPWLDDPKRVGRRTATFLA